MQDKLQGLENTPAVTNRRACLRLRVTALIYMDIGNVNGGIVTSLSENGLALTAAGALRNAELGDGPLRMRIQIPGVPKAIEASGQIVWMSPSEKEACVKFVELDEGARNQLRNWIASQASSNGRCTEQIKLPKMQLPNSRRAKTRASRFSFADVASSRIDGETETGVEAFPETGGESPELPPLEIASFRNGVEAVASAFDSPVFTEVQTREAHSSRSGQRTIATREDHPQQQPFPSIPERRQHSRKQILLFTYAVLGDDNGGLAFNLGEGGFALTAAAALQEHHFAKIRLRFPDSADWIEASGRLAWKSDSGKEAGVEFLNLPEDVRSRIREWVSQEEPAGSASPKGDDVRTSQSGVQELPHFMGPPDSPAQSFEIPASFQEQPFEDRAFEAQYFEEPAKTSSPSSSALFKTGIKGILERASVRRQVARIKPPEFANRSVKPPTGAARKALASAAGLALAVASWMFLQRAPLNKASRIIAQRLYSIQTSKESAQKPDATKTEATTVGVSVDPPVLRKESSSVNAATQTDIIKRSVQQVERGSPAPNKSKTAESAANSGGERTSREKPSSEEALAQKPPATSPPRSSDQGQRPAPSKGEPETMSPRTAASAPAPSSENKLLENKPAETKPVQIAQTFPEPNKDLNAKSPSPNSNPPQPAAAEPVASAKEKPPVPPKQPDPLVTRTPLVTVSFDPFPSIRMPKAEKSKKTHQGKSLQMGRLLTRVDPVYPEEARQQGVEGTARVHAIFNRDGSPQSVISLSGPPMLVAVTMSAVRQWRYSQTILGGQAMETEEDVAVQFRLENSATKN